LQLVVQGKLNKQIASDLGIAIKTVESHRSSVMKKMQVAHFLSRRLDIFE